MWRRYEYKHTTLALVAIALFVLALDTAIVQALVDYLRHLGIAGIVIAGAMFTSFFTTAPAIVLLTALADHHDPIKIAIYGAAGAAVGDWIILRVFEEKVGYELKPLVKKWHLGAFFGSFKRKKNRERTTLLGMAAIASPLPDEIGIGLLGISHLPTISLLVITYLLNAAGIFILLVAI